MGRAMLAPLDRRAPTRLPDPSCRLCGAEPDHVHVRLRTISFISFGCDVCGTIWQVNKPRNGSQMRWKTTRRADD